ncbi:MAG TPA: PilC/PilY family type IV pilus protein [Burkholderiaceae bacterium]|nr:PilC/PilY family type IV pilus protein [Burkholderiaceae bacterium]
MVAVSDFAAGKRPFIVARLVLAAAALAFHGASSGVVIQDDLTQSSAQLNWSALNGACLTAGNGTGTIPACVGLSYYSGDPNALKGGATGTLPDTAGNGALRFTDWTSQNGAVVSNFTFPASDGVNVVFTTVTYLGDSGGTGKDGADGIGFFLMDGAVSPNLGAWGGSLAYSCSNSNAPYDGLVGAYLGLGIDEFGNFLNQSDNTSTGFGYQPGRIGLRGNGNVAWSWLNANYPNYYPSSLNSSKRQAAVQNTCKTGNLWNYSSGSGVQTSTAVANYLALPNGYKVLPSSNQIANESAVKRSDGVPITYNLQVTQDGRLSLAYSYNGGAYQPVLTNQSITASNGALPSNLRFGFTGSTGGSRNIHEITCFRAQPAEQADSSAGINTQQTSQVQIGTQVYLSFYHSNNWWGQLTSQNLVYNSSTNTVTISSSVNWDASCVLTGGSCAATGTTTTAQGPANRQILTWNGTTGTGLEWSNLTTAQQNALDAGDATPYDANRLNYLRGDRTNEITTSGTGLFRARTSVLADVYHSTPTWVGPPVGPYSTLTSWTDNLYTTATMAENASTAQRYSTFASNNATRLNVVYAGANDGMVHGFRSGSYDGAVTSSLPFGNYVSNSTTPNDGAEMIAYMPGAVLQTIHNNTTSGLDYSSTQYGHAFSVDQTPGTGDLFYNSNWHTWLVGGLGAGGSAIYALDITNPSNFSESNASSLVMGEWTPSTLSCINVSSCGNHLGNTWGTPAIRRFHNGSWGFVFGNGLSSSSGHAGIYIVLVDPTSGAKSAYFLDTGYTASNDPTGANRPDGITFVTPADLDGDHVVDYIYAGDLFGNLWRFDVTSNNPSYWTVSHYGNSGPTPLFSTPSGQPITTRPLVLSTPATSGSNRLMVDFGTGQEIPLTLTAATSYATGTQSLYGIWDWDMGGWNSVSPSVQYAALTGSRTISTSQLTTQTITLLSAGTSSSAATRTVTTKTVCWYNSSTCSGSNTKFGWLINLPNTNEQVIYSPIIYGGAFIINTTVPAAVNPFACTPNLPSGWTMALNPTSGGALPNSFFADSNNNFVTVNGSVVSGIALNATGSPSVVTASNNPYLVNQTTSGIGTVNQINPPGGTTGGRVTWNQLR